jgi:uncharacterized protein YutE (UPF0331/DUF86 family)
MSPLRLRLHAEIEQIQQALDMIPAKLDNLAPLELAGLGSVIHSFYNGIENMLKQIFKQEGIQLPESAFWHRDLLDRACNEKIISPQTLDALKEYLGFRHFFVHAYSPQLDLGRLRPLVEKAPAVLQEVLADLTEAWL